MKKLTFSLVFVIQVFCLFGQINLERSYSLEGVKKVNLDFTWPDLITVTAATGNELVIRGKVNINNGEENDHFILEENRSEGLLTIKSFIKEMEQLKKMIMVKHGKEEIYFPTTNRDDPNLKKFLSENPGYTYMNHGPIIQIELIIEIPENIETTIHSVYGLVEIKKYSGQLLANSTYGGVDFTLAENLKNGLKAKTRYGEIYTDVTVPISASGHKNPGEWFVVEIPASQVIGKIQLESTYGNIYLRKAL